MGIGLVGFGMFLAFVLSQTFGSVVSANPLFFVGKTSATASTTLTTYMTAGTGTTTTPVFDAYAGGVTTGIYSAVLGIQFNASSTNTMYRWRYEYADDMGINCVSTPLACDWYAAPESTYANLTITATTTPIQYSSGATDAGWLFASSSQGAAVIASDNNRALRLYNVPTPARYVRAVIYLATASTNGAVFTDWIGEKEQR